jgi:hypothetical protein
MEVRLKRERKGENKKERTKRICNIRNRKKERKKMRQIS